MIPTHRARHPMASAAAFILLGAGAIPAQAWQEYTDLQKAGWSATDLAKAREVAVGIGSAAVLVVDHGRVVAAWGHVDHPYKTASIRKSVYDATIGAVHRVKPFAIDTSLAQMKIDDIQPLTEEEQKATLEQLMTARSGVYHPAAYETGSNARRRPERGSAAPGTRWYYNNWDYNVVCTAFRRLTGTSFASAFATRLAQPLGMEDFKPHHVFAYLEPRVSRHPAMTLRLSARDLARVGRLYLQKGEWGDKTIVAADWIGRSTRPHTTFEAGHYRGAGRGYGRMWWVFPPQAGQESGYESHHRIAAQGAGGQLMVLFPGLDLLIVHLADTDRGRGVSTRDLTTLLDHILGARKGERAANCPVGPVTVEKLHDREPGALRTDFGAVPKARRTALVGRFMVTEQMGLRLYEHDARLFAQPLGMPMSSDLELLTAPDDSLGSPVVPLRLQPLGGAGGKVDAVRVTFRGRTLEGKRQPSR